MLWVDREALRWVATYKRHAERPGEPRHNVNDFGHDLVGLAAFQRQPLQSLAGLYDVDT